jgi:protein-disulfide isomerase
VTKIYCFVDESGQDSMGKFFLVSVIVADKDKDKLEKEIIKIEKESGKGSVKWVNTRDEAKFKYIRQVLKIKSLKGRLNYSVYKNTTDYLAKTVLTTARVITNFSEDKYKAVVFVDGLRKSQTKWFGAELRHLYIKTEKVRGVKKEESSALMRLADALCGFVRYSILKNKKTTNLFAKAKKEGVIKEI